MGWLNMQLLNCLILRLMQRRLPDCVYIVILTVSFDADFIQLLQAFMQFILSINFYIQP